MRGGRVRIVNGFVCQTGCDERVARHGIDPRNPRDDPMKQKELDREKALRSGVFASASIPKPGDPGALVDRLA